MTSLLPNMMSTSIKNFPKQFSYDPVTYNYSLPTTHYSHYFVIGMGGSHLAADLAKIWNPQLPLTIVSDYGLPPEVTKKDLVIASSYSGNTEETIDGLKIALKKKLPVVVIAVGGKLIALAKKNNLPYIQLPDTGIQPRSALGFSLRALLKIVGDERGLLESKKLAKTLDPIKFEKAGKTLAKKLEGRVPVIYSSLKNSAIAYNWKIKLNETGKIPAFYNVLPELNHNEMNGFDAQPSTKQLCNKFHFIFLKDKKDHPRVQKRMAILERLYRNRGLPVEISELQGKTVFEKMFSSLVLADWTAVYIAKHFGLESEQVPMVEEFKKLMKN
ncbi:bifunctional phosphoglucose/phosphomannose isomerase [Candidatus Uhrbacteria bacterium]|nr:bifunctional phosphoglucose/phosphomannose isomerase [Candidatus Uhrbacteria bacterium]